MKWTQDHSKVNLHFTLANGSDISLFMCYHIALIPLLKTVQKDICLESGLNAPPTIYTRVKTRLCTWSNTTTQTPLDSVGMQPHREQPQATNLMDLLCDQLGTTKCIPITEGQGPLEWTFADLQPGIARMTKKQPIKIIVDNLSNPIPCRALCRNILYVK